jgi:electron transport complex protein RnfB
MSRPSPEDIDAILPQTQCGLCGHGGCMPYAEALVFDNAAINLCPPGGIPVLQKLGEMMQIAAAPFEDEMREKAKPKLLAVIREAECIGCTKCIQACPVDAILGSSKSMHTVITNECTGCELCVPPCPVDCIDLIEIEPAKLDAQTAPDSNIANSYRQRFQSREQRLLQEKARKDELKRELSLKEKRNYIDSALARVRAKKS